MSKNDKMFIVYALSTMVFLYLFFTIHNGLLSDILNGVCIFWNMACCIYYALKNKDDE